MTSPTVFDTLAQYGVIPVIAIDSLEAALPLADALIEGGLPIAEITFRTVAAVSVIAKLAQERPNLIVGAGTVLTIENLLAARECGASFAVAPGLNPNIVEKAKGLGLPFIPGVATPTDIETGLSLGCSLLKLFPSEALGGIPYLKALTAPYGHTGVRFVPTGGVTPKNLEEYLATAGVAAVGGTWIAKKEDIAQGRWEVVQARCQEALALVAQTRSGQ